MTPRDRTLATTTGLVKAARVFSNLVSPPIMFALLGLAVAWRQAAFWPGLAWAALYGFWVSLMPILFVAYLLRTGRIAELHMSNNRERHLPYLVAVTGAAVAGLLIWAVRGPELLVCLAVFNALELALLGLINAAWLISIHATGMTATTLLAGLIFGPLVAWALTPLLLLVCWARLFLKRHSLAQVLAGISLGVVSVLALATLTGCFQ